jgi:hypothetical protein
MEFIARVNSTYLAAITCFAAKNDVRFYLEGVYIAPHPQGGVLIVATDGHCMGLMHDPDGFANAPIILRSPDGDFLKALKARDMKPYTGSRESKTWISERCSVVTYSGNSAPPELFGCDVLATVKSELVDGKFPDIVRVIAMYKPSDEKTLPFMNVALIDRFTKAASILGKNDKKWPGAFQFITNGEHGQVIVRFEKLARTPSDKLIDRFMGVIMPAKDIQPNTRLPDFVGFLVQRYEKGEPN